METRARYYQAPQRDSFLWERYQIPENLVRLPSLTLKVLFRQKVGLRRVPTSHLFLMACVLLVINSFASGIEWCANLPTRSAPRGSYVPHPHLLPTFALLVVMAGLWQQRNRWKELRLGVFREHSYNDGISPFESVLWKIMPAPKSKTPFPLSPSWWLSESRITRIADPLALFAVGYVLYPLDWALSYWIMFASACLAVDESLMWRSALTVYLDLVDNLVNAEAMKQWQPTIRSAPNATKRTEVVVPTSLGEDILRHIQARAQEQRQIPPAGYVLEAPDNLATPERLQSASVRSSLRRV